GPGQVLSGLTSDCVATPVIALDSGGPSLKGLLCAIGAAFAAGAPLDHSALFRGRFTHPFSLDWKPKFFTNPCELAPAGDRRRSSIGSVINSPNASLTSEISLPPLDLLRQLIAQRAELPVSAVRPENRMLGDLHLNSITVGQL